MSFLDYLLASVGVVLLSAGLGIGFSRDVDEGGRVFGAVCLSLLGVLALKAALS